MDILEHFYDLKPRNDLFHPRKLQLPGSGSFALFGARATGKSALILEWLRERPDESWLYLDAQDPVFALEDIDVELLEGYLEEEGIRTLVIDHWYEGFLERLPEAEELILISRNLPETLPFPRYELFPLDYEEFLGFDRGHSPTLTFNRFLRVGTLPALSRTPPASVSLRLRSLFYEMFDDAESRLLLILARFQGRRVTAHQIYTTAREYFRISKDWTYAALRRFREEKLIFFIPEAEKGSGKKLILYDFLLTRYLNKRQPFPVTFDAMVALALIKHGFPFVSMGTLGYRLEGREEIVLPAAFENEEQFWRRAQSNYGAFRRAGASRVTVVSVSNRYSFRIGAIEFEALPFYEWSILNE